jgi:PAS domain S-box-containing protein
MKKIYYLRNFQIWQNFWAVFFSLLGFLFVLHQADFLSFEIKKLFAASYWGYLILAVLAGFITGGLLRLIGIKGAELPDKRIINDNVDSKGFIIDSISDKELLEFYNKIKVAPVLLLKRYLIYGSGLGIISGMITGIGGASMGTIIILAISIVITVLVMSFFGILLSERLSSHLLRECKRKIYQRGLPQDEKKAQLFSLRNRVYYFIFLFFILVLIAITGIKEITPILLVFSFLSLLMIAITARVLFSSIYLMFKEIEDFASDLPTSSRTRYLTGSSYKEALELSDKLNKSAEKLYKSRRRREGEKEKVSAIINNFAGPIIFADSKNRVTLFNSAATEVLGMTAKDYGKKISTSHNYSLVDFEKVIHKKYEIESVEKGGQEDYKDNGYSKGEIIKLNHQGEEKIYRIQTSSVYDENRYFLGVVKVFYDLTTEKAITQAKNKFISVAAHQLRTPLSGIKWIVKMALDADMGKFNKEQTGLLEKAYASNEKIINLIDDLLNVSRIEEGKFGYKIKKEDFGELLDEKMSDFNYKIEEKGIDFTINKPQNPPAVYIDKEKIGLALQNFIDNAIKYTPEGGSIGITVKEKKKFLEIRVKDSGVGIPEKDQDKIFSKFYRASNVSRSDIGGSGLGLFIAKNIIEGHGGEVELESEENKGAEVIFRLPIHK